LRIYWFYSLICISTVLFSITGIILTPIDWRGKIWAKIVRYWAKSILWIVNIPYTMIGLDKLDPNQQYVFASNHESAFDIPLTLAGIPWHVVPVAKKELKKIPFLSWAMLAAGHIFIDRSNHKKALQSMGKIKNSLKKNPRSILIFPEGTRSLDGKMKPFKKGGIILAIDTGLPIVPIACCGTFDVLIKGSKNFNPNPIELRFGDPIDTSSEDLDNRNEITERVKQAVINLKSDWNNIEIN